MLLISLRTSGCFCCQSSSSLSQESRAFDERVWASGLFVSERTLMLMIKYELKMKSAPNGGEITHHTLHWESLLLLSCFSGEKDLRSLTWVCAWVSEEISMMLCWDLTREWSVQSKNSSQFEFSWVLKKHRAEEVFGKPVRKIIAICFEIKQWCRNYIHIHTYIHTYINKCIHQ